MLCRKDETDAKIMIYCKIKEKTHNILTFLPDSLFCFHFLALYTTQKLIVYLLIIYDRPNHPPLSMEISHFPHATLLNLKVRPDNSERLIL